MFEGGTNGADLTRAAISQTRDEMIEAGAISAIEIERDFLQLNRPDFMMPSRSCGLSEDIATPEEL